MYAYTYVQLCFVVAAGDVNPASWGLPAWALTPPRIVTAKLPTEGIYNYKGLELGFRGSSVL